MKATSSRYAVALSVLLAAPSALAQFNTNLLVNPGAQAAVGGDGSSSFAGNLPGWTVGGEMMAIAYALGCPQGYPCATPADPGPASPGLNHFTGGNVATSTATQLVGFSFAAGALAAGGVSFSLSGWLGGYASQDDSFSLLLTWLNPVGSPISQTSLGPVTAADRGNVTALLFREVSGLVPSNAVSARLGVTSMRVSGT